MLSSIIHSVNRAQGLNLDPLLQWEPQRCCWEGGSPEGRVLVAEHCIHAQLLGARRDPGWSGVSWAGIWGPRGDPVSGPPLYICSLCWAVWMAVWGYEVPL